MLLSVYTPQSRHDEEDYIETLEAVRRIMNEGKMMEAADVYIGCDINIELKLEITGEDFQGLDGIIDRFGMYGPECRGGGEDVVTYEQKLRWLQQVKEVNYTVTSTWVDADDRGRNVILGRPGDLEFERNKWIIIRDLAIFRLRRGI